jgi:hypothetical protein
MGNFMAGSVDLAEGPRLLLPAQGGWQTKDREEFPFLAVQGREQKGGQRFLEQIKPATSSL